MSVFVDGSALSSLLYSHSNSVGNQEGLLLGQIVKHVKDHISDSQVLTSQVLTCMYVSSHLPWPKEDLVYSRGGVPINEKVAALLGDSYCKEDIIGWYSFRRNTSLRMSVKERTLHKHFENQCFPQMPEHFLFFMCTDTASSDKSTHTLDHCFCTVSQSGKVNKIPLTVTNLGDTLHTQYKIHASTSVSQSSAVKTILHQFHSQFISSSEEMDEVKRIDNLSNTLNQNLLRLCKQVAKSEQRTGELEREVLQLKKQLLQKEYELAQQQNHQGKESRMKEGDPSDINRTSLEKKLVMGLPHDSVEMKSVMPEDRRIDNLLSIPNVSGVSGNLNVNAGDLHFVNPFSNSGPTVLKSVDNITHIDKEDVLGIDCCSPTKLLSDHSGPMQVEFSLELNYVKPTRLAEKLGSLQSTKQVKSKSRDHFSFVDSMLSSDGNTTTVPTGATLTFSTRATRSQTKSSADMDTGKSKLKNIQRRLETHSRNCVKSAPKSDRRSAETVVASLSSEKAGLPQLVNSEKSDYGETASIDCVQEMESGTDSSVKASVNQPYLNLRGQHKNYSQHSSSKTVSKNSSNCDKVPYVSQENGSTGIEEVGNNLCHSSSPIF